MRKLIVFLVVVVLLIVGADRGAKYAAQSAISKQLVSSYDLDPAPEVEIHGFPFLTQAINGTYDQIDVDIPAVTRDNVRVENVHTELFGVHAPISQVINNAREITASRATGTGLLPFDIVRKRLPDGFKVTESGGDLTLSGKARALGMSVPVKAKLRLSVGVEGVIAKPTKITVANGRVPDSVVAGQLRFVVPVQNLPMHLKVRHVSVEPNGIRVSASASDVRFTQS